MNAAAQEVIKDELVVHDAIEWDRPNIFIAGPSGSGKSTSLKNLDPKNTIIINTEDKTLPFRGAAKFNKAMAKPKTWEQFNTCIDRALASDREIVIIESFTEAADLLFQHCVRYSSDTWDGWAEYKNELRDLFIKCKVSNKFFVFIGISDSVQDDAGRITQAVGVQGSWKGKIESQFEIVLFTSITMDKKHIFITNSEPRTSAKSPDGMLDREMPNDIAKVISLCAEFYTGGAEQED